MTACDIVLIVSCISFYMFARITYFQLFRYGRSEIQEFTKVNDVIVIILIHRLFFFYF